VSASSSGKVRCAIYTRVSSDQGLEQDFNSLDAQYDASAAYIRSQAHAGWSLVRTQYDDGGFSGGNTERPALQRLLEDIRAGKIDIVVVYKVDRLTRSLADFAKLVELFDQHGVSFVSVTQQFNTTTSMGRLTLNVLLSFAQFERELTSERIRDKIAASKRKGLWVGGVTPLGYAVKDKSVVVVEKQAKQVRTIFETYLRLGSTLKTLAELRRLGIVTKVRQRADGTSAGGIPFTRGPLSYLLRNRFFIGEVVYKGEILKGPQKPIIDRALFNAVQECLAQQLNREIARTSKSGALLAGKIFDDRGNAMAASHTRKNGVKYRYYISRPLLNGETDKTGTINRVPVNNIETAVIDALRKMLSLDGEMSDRDLIDQHLARIEVQSGQLVITLNRTNGALDTPKTAPLTVPWQKPPSKKRRELLKPDIPIHERVRPIRAEHRARLLRSIAKGRLWLNELLTSPTSSQDAIAKRERCSVRKINMTISLAFLAPSLIKAVIDGRLPRGFGITQLCDLPADWSEQYKKLGLTPPIN
jgi:site-specific DNA recombinase